MPEVAVPSAVAYITVTGWGEAADRLTVKLAMVVPLALAITVALPIATVGTDSGLRIRPRPTPKASAIVAPLEFARMTTKVLSGDLKGSAWTVTWIGFWISPGLNVSVP